MKQLAAHEVLLNFVPTKASRHNFNNNNNNVCTLVIAYLKAEEDLLQDEPSHCAVCSMSVSGSI
jgi:hypothetical protein